MTTKDVLSKDEVNSLLGNEKSSDVYDFTEPLISQIEHGQMFKILDTLFVDELSYSLTQFLHLPINVKDSGIELSRYDKVTAEIKNKPRSYHSIKLMPDMEHLLVSISQPLLYYAIELLFGGNPNSNKLPEKTLSPIELKVADKLTEQIMLALAKAWESVAHKKMEIEQTSHHPLRIPICTSGEKILVIKYEIELRDTQSDFVFGLPIKLFDFKTQKENDKEKSKDPEHIAWQLALKQNVLNSPIQLTAVLTSTKTKISKIRNLKEGDIIPIPTPKEGKLLAENIPIYSGICGTHDDHNVFKINNPLFD